jgi:hypothetical protein
VIWSTPLLTPIAPEQEHLDGATTAPMPTTAKVSRPRVEPVLDVPHRTVSAGAETVPDPRYFDQPRPLRAGLYKRMVGSLTRTLLVPETQGDIDLSGKANVMPPRAMAQPYEAHQPGPWYESFLKQM